MFRLHRSITFVVLFLNVSSLPSSDEDWGSIESIEETGEKLLIEVKSKNRESLVFNVIWREYKWVGVGEAMNKCHYFECHLSIFCSKLGTISKYFYALGTTLWLKLAFAFVRFIMYLFIILGFRRPSSAKTLAGSSGDDQSALRFSGTMKLFQDLGFCIF